MTTWAGGVGRPSWEPGSHDPANKSSGTHSSGRGGAVCSALTYVHLSFVFRLRAVVPSTPHLQAKDLGSDPEPGTSQLGYWQITQSHRTQPLDRSLAPQRCCNRLCPFLGCLAPTFSCGLPLSPGPQNKWHLLRVPLPSHFP